MAPITLENHRHQVQYPLSRQATEECKRPQNLGRRNDCPVAGAIVGYTRVDDPHTNATVQIILADVRGAYPTIVRNLTHQIRVVTAIHVEFRLKKPWTQAWGKLSRSDGICSICDCCAKHNVPDVCHVWVKYILG
jgi:hypothetical protein